MNRLPSMVLKLFWLGWFLLTVCAVCFGQGNNANSTKTSERAEQQSSATLSGVVRDSDGVIVPAVHVKLEGPDNTVLRSTTSDNRGAFRFSEVAPAMYHIEIEGGGVEPSISESIALSSGDTKEIPISAVRLPISSTTVDVAADLKQVAQAQVEQEEKQRILGVLPNFYTTYIWDAAPLTKSLKYGLAFRASIDPLTFLVAAGVAGVRQANNTFPGYGQEAQGYAKRFGSTYADTVAGRVIGSAILPSLFHQDPRYFYRGTGSVRSRMLHALVSTVVCKGDNGQLEPNYSHMLGSFAAAGFSNLYRSPADRRVGLTLSNGLVIFAGGAVVNLMREFFSRQLTPHVPSFASGKP